MTDAHAEAIDRLMRSYPASAHVTHELMAEMLEGFALQPLKGFDWFSDSIRPLVFVVARERSVKSNAKIRDDFHKLADHALDLFQDIMLARPGASDELWAYVDDLTKLKENYDASKALAAYYETDSLMWLAKFYRGFAERLDSKKQRPKWRAKSKQKLRVWIAISLTPTFEDGFGRNAALDKWPNASDNKSLGYWADFYQRVMAAAFNESVTPNLEGVLVEARKQVRAG